MQDYYAILGIPPDTRQEKIKEQWRLLVLAWHPDRFPEPAQKVQAGEKFKEINEAYEVLSDTTKRAQYDRERGGSWFKEEEQRHAKQEHQRKQQAGEKQRYTEYERELREQVEEERQREYATSTQTRLTQGPAENIAAWVKFVAGLLQGVFASFVVSTIWVVAILVLFEQSRDPLSKIDSVVIAIEKCLLLPGGLVMIFFAGIFPVYESVGGRVGIVGGLVVGFIGLVAGIVAGAIIMTIVFSIVFA